MKEFTDTLWAAFASDKRWEGISGAERVNNTTIIVMPFDGRPITTQLRRGIATAKQGVIPCPMGLATHG